MAGLRQTWRRVRVLPYGPRGRVLDDYGVYVHDASPDAIAVWHKNRY